MEAKKYIKLSFDMSNENEVKAYKNLCSLSTRPASYIKALVIRTLEGPEKQLEIDYERIAKETAERVLASFNSDEIMLSDEPQHDYYDELLKK